MVSTTFAPNSEKSTSNESVTLIRVMLYLCTTACAGLRSRLKAGRAGNDRPVGVCVRGLCDERFNFLDWDRRPLVLAFHDGQIPIESLPETNRDVELPAVDLLVLSDVRAFISGSMYCRYEAFEVLPCFRSRHKCALSAFLDERTWCGQARRTQTFCLWAATFANFTAVESAICGPRAGRVFGQPAQGIFSS
jgi:hypothetical protein